MKNPEKVVRTALIALLSIIVLQTHAQQRLRIAVLSIESKNVEISSGDLTDLVRYELEKSQRYDVIGKHDVALLLERSGDSLNNLYSETLLIERGKKVGADKMLTGSMMRFSDRIIVSFKVLNVHTGQTDRSNVIEYVNAGSELRNMIQLSIKRLLNMAVDEQLFTELTEYEASVDLSEVHDQLNLAGPRFGVGTLTGTQARNLREYTDISPVYTVIGYQFETRYMKTGEYQMLGEWIFALNGLEKGAGSTSFSASWLNGIRNNRTGFEVGAGMLFSTSGANGPSLRLVTAIGKTIKSGQVNFPINLYFVPSKDQGAVGLIVGFNSKTL